MSETSTSKALRLADWIADQWVNDTIGGITQEEVSEVMQELRDQHALIQKQKDALKTCREVGGNSACDSEQSYDDALVSAALAAAEAHK